MIYNNTPYLNNYNPNNNPANLHGNHANLQSVEFLRFKERYK